MIHQESNKDSYNKNLIRLRNEPYLVINIFFAAIIIFVFIYSALFSPEKNNYPVVCIHEKITGIKCASCGLSHSFSLIIRGKISEALTWNENGLKVFIFFALQLVMRAGFSAIYVNAGYRKEKLIIIDSAISGAMFLFAFMPYMVWLVKMMGS
ncbi:MAG TPA: DUF2752 domain-containing protein [Bacteroidales bacterium]|nr:DUF2752 domain-containing protein [Bacteroidales bacterium]